MTLTVNFCEEKADLVLPSSAIPSLRKALIEAANEESAQCWDLAVKIHAHLRSAEGTEDRKLLLKSLRTLGDYPSQSNIDALDLLLCKQVEKHDGPSTGGPEGLRTDFLPKALIVKALIILLPVRRYGKLYRGQIRAPKQEDLLPLLVSETWSFKNNECLIVIDQKNMKVKWRVPYGNHAVERAHQSLLGRAFFKAIDGIEWTPSTGGVFRYAKKKPRKECGGDLGSGASVSLRFPKGPLGEEEMNMASESPKHRRKPGLR